MRDRPPGNAPDLLDPDRPDALRLEVAEATALGEHALSRIGFPAEEARIVTDQLIDNSLCGYRFAGLPRILAIARDAKTGAARTPIRIVHETANSALVDGGNNVGYVAVYRGMEIAIAKAKETGIASVGVYNSYYSGRNAYYLERIVAAGLVGLHTASGSPHVVPPGGRRPALGTNPTTDAREAARGGVAPWGGHKGFGLSFAIQALGLLAGAALPHGNVQDYGFLFFVVDPGVMLPGNDFAVRMAELVASIKATPRQPGVPEIRIPSERAFRERERRRVEGILIDRAIVAALEAL